MYSLGIDVGYSSLKIILINDELEVLENIYRLHKGRVKEELDSCLSKLITKYGSKIINAAATGQGSRFITHKQELSWINEVTSLIEGSRKINGVIGSIVEIGGQSSKFITNLEDNSNIKISINSNCSAGTGSFLEEQVSRLNIKLEDYSKITETATYIPRIAGRCSVFAKTDIIHHQQEGVDSKDILLGLAYALVKNYRANVIKKNPINKPVFLAGGVAYNSAIVDALKVTLKLTDEELITNDNCGSIAALGAAIIAKKEGLKLDLLKLFHSIYELPEVIAEEVGAFVFPGLRGYGEDDSINKHNCKEVQHQSVISGYIGLDIGSTSTNVVLMDEEKNVISYKYLRTLGDPIKAVKAGLMDIKRDFSCDIKIIGVGATGSGRYLAGGFVGADVIIDEITAQAKAAHFIDNEVDTIIEIGGQDSKFIKLTNGVVSDFEMNKICAAGTGSFIEEQAKKLNIPINEFGALAMSSENPIDLGDRCTVFIETNIAASLSKDAKIEDIAAGLSYSIAKNYLNKVVGNKEIGKKVFFQGGVAHNPAVVNAFRALLGDKLYIPEFFSVTGAYGAAILAKEGMQGSATAFKGFDPEPEATQLREVTAETKQEKARTKVFEEIEKYYLKGYIKTLDPYKKTVGIPRVLFLHKLFPLFNTYFNELGFNVLLSENSSEETVELSQEFSMEETCYPIKLINGHVAQLVRNKADYIFLPSLYTMAHPISTTRQNYGCVYMQCFPKLINKSMDLEEKGVQLLSPELSFEFGKKYMMKTLLKLGKKLGRSHIATAIALAKGMKSLKAFENKVEKLGEETLRGLGKDEKAFVIVTRAYGISDPILNMGIPEKLERLGYKVLTLSNLPAHDHDTSKEHPNMYWPFGQHILSGAQIIRQHPNLYAIYITNHGCGPDTILSHYFKEEMKGKPYLNIEVDEHFSSVGVLTRLEAFVNSLKSEEVKADEALDLKGYSARAPHKKVNIKESFEELDEGTEIFIPYLYPYSHLMATYLQTKGYKAEVLPMTSKKTLDIGRKHVLSKEYFSFTGLVGDVISKAYELKNEDKSYAFFIPTNEGSEAGGQYYRLLREKLDNEGFTKVEIVAPFIEDLIKEPSMWAEIILLLLGGDIINLAKSADRNLYLRKIQGLILNDTLRINTLVDLAQEVYGALLADKQQKKLFLVGEINVLFNDFMNNNIFKKLEEEGIQLISAPMSEYMWLVWKDYLSKKSNSTDALAQKNIALLTDYISKISKTFSKESSFESNIADLVVRGDKYLGLYSGGNGRYRRAKALGVYADVKGTIVASSMYENTNTILSILSQNENSDSRLPILNITFDGNENELDKSKIDSFIYYTLKESPVDSAGKRSDCCHGA